MGKIQNNKFIYAILILACIIGFWVFENFYTPASYSSPKDDVVTKNQFPYDLMPSSTTGAIVEHNYFILSYNEEYEQAEWVAYTLSKNQLTNKDRKRPYFIEDPKIKTKSADWRNYKGSGYDRGHLCPAGDRRFSEQAYNETFYTSNISPQDAEFNAGIWNRLEQQIRQWAKKHNKVFVITAGVLENGLKTIGEEDVAVPKYFFKIVLKGEKEKMELIAFLIPSVESTEPLQTFTVPIDEIERISGIDFFEKLEDAQERALEGSVFLDGWKF